MRQITGPGAHRQKIETARNRAGSAADLSLREKVDEELPGENFFFGCELDADAELADVDPSIHDRLKHEISIHFDDVSLRHALTAIAREAHINIAVEPAALRRKRLTLDSRCTINADGIRAKTMLNLLLTRWGLDHVIGKKFVWIDLPREERVVIRDYPVGDLAYVHDESGSRFLAGPLVSMLVEVIGDWTGGSGDQFKMAADSIQEKPELQSLTIEQTATIHVVVAEHLGYLRHTKREFTRTRDVDFPMLKRILSWKHGFYPRERLKADVLIVHAEVRGHEFDVNGRSFNTRENLLSFVADQSDNVLQSGIVCCRKPTLHGFGISDAELEDRLESFCRERDVDFFIENWAVAASEASLFRKVKSSKSIYKDEP